MLKSVYTSRLVGQIPQEYVKKASKGVSVIEDIEEDIWNLRAAKIRSRYEGQGITLQHESAMRNAEYFDARHYLLQSLY